MSKKTCESVPICKNRPMRLLLIIILMSRLSYAAELRFAMSKKEMQSSSQLIISDQFKSIFQEIIPDVELSVESKTGNVIFSGSESDLKTAEYVYLTWIREIEKVQLKFSHFEGTPDNRLAKGSFIHDLKANESNSFQFSNKIIKGVGNNINGFSFEITPVKDLFEDEWELHLKLSYKNEDMKVGDKGSKYLDLKTSLTVVPGREYIIKITDESDLGWHKNSFITFEINPDPISKSFKYSVPRELSLKDGQILRVENVSNGIKRIIGNEPQKYLEGLGVNFDKNSRAHFLAGKNTLILQNSRENIQRFEQTLRLKNRAKQSNLKSTISLYESNLIIKDPDKLEGHSIKKISSFTTACSRKNDFLLSKSFKGEYESTLYTSIKMPQVDNEYSFHVILKSAGPKSKAQNFRFEGNFVGRKKYRIHLDDYHYMEIQVEK